jgi:hypothetical protein
LTFKETHLKEYKKSVIPDKIRIKQRFSKGSYMDVIKSMFPPAIRLPLSKGVFLYGYDVIYEHHYSLYLNSERLRMNLRSNFFTPFEFGFTVDTKGKEEDVSFYGSYPIYRALESGLSLLQVGMAIKFDEKEEYTSKKFLPNIIALFRYPKLSIFTRLSCVIERNDGIGGNFFGIVSKYLSKKYSEHGSEMNFILQALYDPEEMVKVWIRGYEDSIPIQRGVRLTLSHETPIFKIRYGFWNPNIFFEDLSFLIFADSLFGKGIKPRLSGGMEFKVEGASSFSFPFVPTIGLAINRDKEITIYFNLRF